MKKSTKSLPKGAEKIGAQMTLFSLADFHANPTPSPENEKESKMIAISGLKCLGLFERYNRAGSWAKTFSALLIGMEGWFSKRCRLTWKLKGTKYNRMYFQLAASTPRTEEIGFGLLLTPRAINIIETPENFRARMNKDGKKDRVNGYGNLEMQIKGMLLTPTTREEVQDLEKFKARMEKYPNGTTMPNLATQVQSMLPTSRVGDAKGGCTRKDIHWQNNQLSHKMHGLLGEAGKTSQLNPRFVAEMMGFPLDWTELPFQNGETKA